MIVKRELASENERRDRERGGPGAIAIPMRGDRRAGS
jgi:hypothetical protein